MRVLVFTRHYLPGFKAGGPIRSIANLVEALGDEIDFRIITLDRDLLDPHPYDGVDGSWHPVGKASVLYLNPAEVTASRLRGLVADTAPDAIYLNSFFDPVFTIRLMMARERLGVPITLAPRGEFSKGAIRQKRLKKFAYVKLWKALGIAKTVKWHASTELELQDIQRCLGRQNIVVARDMGAMSEAGANWLPRKQNDPLRVCFLSRISPKKNLLGALNALKSVRSPVKFEIFGPIEDSAYWDDCTSMMEALPSHVEVIYQGNVAHKDVQGVIGCHDLFFFPTLGENYGHVIAEALSAGVPVLTSDKTPWLDLEAEGVGWALQRDEDFAAYIDDVSRWPTSRMQSVREKCVNYAREALIDEQVDADNRAVFI